jgi:hypothetical protein
VHFLCSLSLARYDFRMSKPYGKRPRKSANKRTPRKPESAAFKIRLRGKEGAPLSLQEVRDGIYEAARKLAPYERDYRFKWATLYLTVIDADGKEVLLDPSGEWTINAYKSAADEHGL